MSATDKEFIALDWLYQEIILDHYKRPRNFGTLESANTVLEEENPYCGDRIVVQIKTDGERITDIRFSGRGCAISQASASMMTERVKGMSLEEALKFAEDFREMMRGEKPFPPEGELEDLDALRGVREFPVRIKCATLAWDLLQRSLAHLLASKNGGDLK
ncbi:MAG: SUF system NifU family Fe-S cluster assembly protein [Armatimonadetes bacterium]|nr:SUF system NifU family Fe-S cluster assembly protein [Armatimonadota bacterium]MDW8027163.1 SUF system NifU family Fe-S cluster assembly protein [Armatimonadota bacterium]